MIIKNSLSKKRLDKEIDAIIKKMISIIEYHAESQHKTPDEICKEWGINNNIFLGRNPTLSQFLKICFALNTPPHSIIHSAYANHEVTLK